MLASGEGLEVITRVVGPWATNSYLVLCLATGQSLLIDPAGEPHTLLEMVDGSELVGVLLTHAHPDHIGALKELRTTVKVPVMAHKGNPASYVERALADGDLVEVGDHALRVYHTPGHTQDSICYYVQDDNRVIVGDAVFEGGPGHTSSPEAFRMTLRTLRDTILAWPDQTVCCPGHGPSFRLGDRRAAIEAFVAKDHGDFFGDAVWEM
jgi:hydroxyacylglutathione hydrolase